MLGLGIFKTKKRKLHEHHMQVINHRKNMRQQAVYNAVVAFKRPVCAREVATYLGWDSASVTNRIAELRHKGFIEIAFVQRGLDHKSRNFYVRAK